MYRILVLSLVELDTIFLLSLPPALAQRTQSRGETTECAAALQSAKRRIEKGRKVKVAEIVKLDVRKEQYTDYPKNRPFAYSFNLSGSATQSLMQSKKLLTTISTDIIKNCDSVSRVDFGQHATDHSVSFGLLEADKVGEFQCISPADKPRWRYVVCL